MHTHTSSWIPAHMIMIYKHGLGASQQFTLLIIIDPDLMPMFNSFLKLTTLMLQHSLNIQMPFKKLYSFLISSQNFDYPLEVLNYFNYYIHGYVWFSNAWISVFKDFKQNRSFFCKVHCLGTHVCHMGRPFCAQCITYHLKMKKILSTRSFCENGTPWWHRWN